MPRQEQVSLPPAQVSGGQNWIQNHNLPLEAQSETWFLVDGCFNERKDLGVVTDENVSLKGRLKPSNSICQLPASCRSVGGTLSLLITLYPLASCSNLTSPASQAFPCALSVNKSGLGRLSGLLSSLTGKWQTWVLNSDCYGCSACHETAPDTCPKTSVLLKKITFWYYVRKLLRLWSS